MMVCVACSGPNHYLKQCLFYTKPQETHTSEILFKIEKKSDKENVSESVVGKMSVILFQSQCVAWLLYNIPFQLPGNLILMAKTLLQK